MVFSVAPVLDRTLTGSTTFQPTRNQVIAALTSTTQVLQFPTNAAAVPLYLKSDDFVPRPSTPYVIQTVIENADLATVLPLVGSKLSDAVTIVRQRIDGQTQLGSDILDITFAVC